MRGRVPVGVITIAMVTACATSPEAGVPPSVSGAGTAPATFAPTPAPVTNPTAPATSPGPAWTLIDTIDGVSTPGFDDAFVAVNAAQWEAIGVGAGWYGIDQLPSVDFDRDIAIAWAYGVSGSCSEDSFDGVAVDIDARVLAPVLSSPYGPETTCTADWNPRVRVVTVARSSLPPVPFDVVDTSGCGDCGATVDDLSATAPAVVPLAPEELDQILLAASAMRVRPFDEIPDERFAATPVEIVDTIGRAGSGGQLEYDDGMPLADSTRRLLVERLTAREVQFVPSTVAYQTRPEAGFIVVGLAAPAILDGRLTITTSVWCGTLCYELGAHEIIVDRQRNVSIGEPVGPQTVA